jgi:RND family efflux transporter MFP subunit
VNRFFAIALVFTGCHSAPELTPDAGRVSVEVATVTRGDVAEIAQASGILQALPGRDVKLAPLVAGTLSQLLVGEGDRVTRGQLLARVDPTAVRDAVSQAEVQLAQAQGQAATAAAKLERAQRAFKAGVAAGQEVDDAHAQDAAAKSAVKAAQASLSTARNQVERSEVHAPFDGIVAHVFAAVGEPIDGSGKPVLEVVDTGVLELHAQFSPGEASRLHLGDSAQVLAEGAPPRSGRVVGIAPTVDAASGAVGVRIRVENADGALKAGGSARAQVTLANHAGVLVVPRSALVPLAQDTSAPGPRSLAVEVVAADGSVHRTAVSVGALGPNRAEIREGLRQGEQVVVQGAYALPDGAQVSAHLASDGGE